MIERKLRAAQAYIARGWHVFVVNGDKRPVGNCRSCNEEVHDPQTCTCLLCHSFYAATQNLNRVRAMLHTVPQGMLAARTGAASGVVALDAEGSDKDGYGCTGVEILDQIGDWYAGVELAETLRSTTTGGGVHLLYRSQGGITSRNRVLPNVDIKAEGGYILLPPGGGRSWQNWSAWAGRLEQPSGELLAFLTSASGSSAFAAEPGNGKASKSLLSTLRTADVVPAGYRYEFTRDLVYFLRKRGYDWSEAVSICEQYWRRYQQPPDGVRIQDGIWYLPFTQVLYELKRAWVRVAPEAPVSVAQMAWARRIAGSELDKE